MVVKGIDGLKIQLSKCCNPIPGDEILGFVSQGQGIKVHRKDCPNIKVPEIQARLIDVYWDFASISTMKFQADLEIAGLDRTNLLNDVITVLGQLKINILNIRADVVDMKATIKLKISVEDAIVCNRQWIMLLKFKEFLRLKELFINKICFYNL